MTVESGRPILDASVMAVDPHVRVVVQNRKREDFPMDILFAPYEL